MGKIVTAISDNGGVVCYAMDAGDIAARAGSIHRTSPAVTVALGRLLTAASLMGSQMKGERDTLTLRVKGEGPAGSVIAVSDAQGNARGYVENPAADVGLNKYGKPDVSGVVGRNGHLFVMKDIGLKEPYIGQTLLVSGEIAEDITYYYAQSEQTPTVCALGVSLDEDGAVVCAGGFLAQLLPGASDEDMERLENNIQAIPPVTKILSGGKTPEEIALDILSGFDAQILSAVETAYRCDCTRERVEKALISLGEKELLEMADEQPVTEVACHFCNKKYRFGPQDLRVLAQK
ncbi:MAG: Hsp33 family molecular chaperone HslO [Oscillospiraceae bacterium]|jgi:molecular chaperone Hsp33|nr:Hsp33 family molecular chaperone HslO [Oscillospiraceae bacterium]